MPPEVVELVQMASGAGVPGLLAVIAYFGSRAVAEARKLRQELADIAHHMDKRISRVEWHLDLEVDK